MGAWFEAQVAKVTVKTAPAANEKDSPSCSTETDTEPHTTVYYHVKFEE